MALRRFWDRFALAAAVGVVVVTVFAQWSRADELDPRVETRDVTASETAQEPVCSGSFFRVCNANSAQRDAAKKAEEFAVAEATDKCESSYSGRVKRKLVFPARCLVLGGFDGGAVECTVRVKVHCEIRREDPRVSDFREIRRSGDDLLVSPGLDPVERNAADSAR